MSEICVAPGSSALDAVPPPSDDGHPDGPPDDGDGDGIRNAEDDCPGVFDPMQRNEDGDAFGDACDPCPPIANDAPVDSDLDGVSDDCDPNPQTPGDVIVLFEGFNDGVPAGWPTVGAWTAGAGFVSIAVSNQTDGELGPPMAVDATSTIAVAFTPTTASNGATGAGPVHYNPDHSQGTLCSIFQDGGQATRAAGIIDLRDDSIFAEAPYSWQTNTTYTFTQTRRGAQYTCTIAAPMKVIGAASNSVMANASIQMFVRGIGGKLAWLMYIDSP